MTTRQITLDIPEKVLLAEKADEASFARELRLLAAVKLYELGRLSSGRAAELAGMPRVEFLLALGRYQGVSVSGRTERPGKAPCLTPSATPRLWSIFIASKLSSDSPSYSARFGCAPLGAPTKRSASQGAL